LTIDISWFGTLLLSAALVCASGSFAVALITVQGLPALLKATRWLFYAAFAFVSTATFLLAYAFQVHDFSLRYVAQYSDRAMTWPYLFAALWAGQDGSLLWWTFTLSGLSALCAYRLRERAFAFEPYLLATLISIIGFFLLVMLFAADPFAKSMGVATFEGQGLNPLLRNPWMLVHPPVLYIGMVGWALPFAFAIGALMNGQLAAGQWSSVARPWVLLAWGALAMGNVLGMVWSYEVLGWGGYWAWDPVENASFLPMLSATAYLHSAIAQERRAIFKAWSVVLLCLTFFMTVFGTFLTRSGMIASVHAFSRSGMAVYFVVFMGLVAALSLGLIWGRRRELVSTHKIESMLSREFIFWLTNVLMVGMLIFVSVATIFPLLSDAVWGETVSVGASFYNRWMGPLGLMLLLLLGLGPLIPWRKSSPHALKRAFVFPLLIAVAVGVVHWTLGAAVGFPPAAPISQEPGAGTGFFAAAMSRLYAFIPLLAFALSAFAITAHLREMTKIAARRDQESKEGALLAFWRRLVRHRRRHGAYLVHLGVALMCVGFAGSLYDLESQAALRPGEAISAGRYQLRFDRPRMEAGLLRHVLVAEMSLLRDGKSLGKLVPGKYFYIKPPGTTTTDVAIRSSLTQDIYVILNGVNPSNRVGTFRVIFRPLVTWIWIGSLLILLGTLICLTVNTNIKRVKEYSDPSEKNASRVPLPIS
jgi:cytochrome c-type biogenesis protein CcmF